MIVQNGINVCCDKTAKEIYTECLHGNYVDLEIGDLVTELYRVVNAFHKKYYNEMFDNKKAIFTSGIVRAFRSINNEKKGEYLGELLDILLIGFIDPYSFPYNLGMICRRNQISDYDLGEILQNLKFDIQDLEAKEYHHPFLKLLYVFKCYKDKYFKQFDRGLEFSFFLQQSTHIFNYFYLNDLDAEQYNICLNYIVNNFSDLYSYYAMNGDIEHSTELRDKILEKTLNPEHRNKKTII